MAYLVGLDIGTSGVKGLLVSEAGEVVESTSSTYEVENPQAGWAEQDPEDWWQATVEVLNGLQQAAAEKAEKIAGISFSGQMHSSVFLDEKDQVIRPAILWSDTRTSRECKEIEDLVGGRENLIELTGNKALEGFTAPKILWLKNNEPANYDKVRTLLLPKDYIRFRLTGEKGMDYSDAAGTLLLDVQGKRWHPEVLEKLKIDQNILPPLLESVEVAGGLTEEVERLTGIPAGTPVVAGGADNACGAVGSGMVVEGRVMVSIGSSGVVLAPAADYQGDPEGRLHLFNHAVPDSFYYMGVMLAAGQSLSWLKNKVLPEDWDYEKLNARAGEVEAGSESLIFLPYLYGERTPHADADARGVFLGLSTRHGRAHLARSVMEGVTFGLKDSLELIKARGVEIKRVRAIGGGARSRVWQQIIADIFDTPVDLLAVEEGPAYGA
ncbi:MAG: xylulokinase, partial [Bacillota bacterium]